jgi:hypothetical protein
MGESRLMQFCGKNGDCAEKFSGGLWVRFFYGFIQINRIFRQAPGDQELMPGNDPPVTDRRSYRFRSLKPMLSKELRSGKTTESSGRSECAFEGMKKSSVLVDLTEILPASAKKCRH